MSETPDTSESPPPSPPPEAPRATRLDVVMTLGIVGVVIAIGAWDPIRRRASPHPSEQDCAALLDRYVEHIAWTMQPEPPASAVAARKDLAKAAARDMNAKAKDAFARCEAGLTRSEFECAMGATSTDAFERCLP